MKRKISAGLLAFSVFLTTVFSGAPVSAAELPGVSVSEKNVQATTHCICGGNCEAATAENGHTDSAHLFTGVTTSSQMNKTTKGEYWLHLNADITNASTVTVPSGVTLHLCLQGHKITTTSTVTLFSISNGGHLTICDCVGTGLIKACATKSAVNVNQGGKLDVYGGTIQGCGADGSATLINGYGQTSAYSDINIYGGTIKDGNGTNGGNFYIQATNFKMYGGKIQNGRSGSNGGNMFTCNGDNVEIFGGEISGGQAGNGGNIVIGSDTVFKFHNGKIINGQAATAGGNIYQSRGDFFLYGGEVSGGSATKYPTTDNIDIVAAQETVGYNDLRATMTGGTVRGGFTVDRAKDFSISGAAVIYTEDESAANRGLRLNNPVFSCTRRIGSMDESYQPTGGHLLSGAKILISYCGDTYAYLQPTGMVFRDGNMEDASYIETPFLQSKHQTLGIISGQDQNGQTVSGLGGVDKTHCVCGGNCESVLNGKAAGAHTCSDVVWEPYNAAKAATAGTHYMYLTANVSSSLTIKDNNVQLYLCFNGYQFAMNGSNRAVMIYADDVTDFTGTTLYLCDCSKNQTGGMKDGYTSLQGGNICATRGANVCIFGGTIQGGTSGQYGGNISVTDRDFAYANFYMFGGTVKDGHAVTRSENIDLPGNGIFRFYGGTVAGTGNTGSVKTGSHTVSVNALPSIAFSSGFEIYGGTFSGTYAPAMKPTGGTALIQDASFEGVYAPAFYNDATDIVISGCDFKNENGYAYYAEHMSTTSGYGACHTLVTDSKFNGKTFFNVSNAVLSGYFTELPEDENAIDSLSEICVLPEKAEGIYGYQVGPVNIIGVSSVSDQGIESIAPVVGGGRYLRGETVVLSAEQKDGYRFSKWQKWNGNSWVDTGSTDLTYYFPAEADGLYRAYYITGANLLTLRVTAPGFSYQINQGAKTGPVASLSETLSIGTSVRLFYEETSGAKFRAWVNGAGHILSTLPEYEFVTSGSTSISALYYGDGEHEGTKVIYLSEDEQIVNTFECYAALSDYQISAGPFRFGKTFSSWDKTLQEINDAIERGDESIIVKGVYTINEQSGDYCTYRIHTVVAESGNPALYTLSNLTAMPEVAPDEKTIRKASTLNITARDYDGKNFICWGRFTDTEFDVLSYGKDLSVYTSDGFDLYAVYSSASVSAIPTIAMTLATATKMPENPGKCIYTFSSTRNLPDGYTLIDSGILYTNETWAGGSGFSAPKDIAACLDLSDTELRKVNWVGSSAGDKVVCTLNVKNIDEGKKGYARSYLRVLYGDEIRVYYSKVAYGSFATGFYIDSLIYGGEGVTDVSVTDTPVYLGAVGDEKEVTAAILPNVSAATSILWKSGAPEIISVEKGENGTATVKALALGSAKITVIVDGIPCSFSVYAGHPDHAIAVTHDIHAEKGEAVTWKAWTSDSSLPVASGNYYLTKDVQLAKCYEMSDDTTVTICLAGHQIRSDAAPTGTAPGRMFSSYTGITLNICDCVGSGEIVANFAAEKSGAAIYTTGTLNLYGGTVKAGPNYQNSAPSFAGLIYLTKSKTASEGTFNMYGGVIEGGKGKTMGGNLALYGTSALRPAFNMYGGEIRNGQVTNVDTAATSSANGGNIAVVNTDVFIGGDSKITAGKATDNFKGASGGQITGKGGNIFANGAIVSLGGNTVLSSGEATYGGGVYMMGTGVSLTLSGNAKISGGTSYSGGGIYQGTGTLLLRDDAEITGNQSSGVSKGYEGGGIAFYGGTLNLSDRVKIKSNNHYSRQTNAVLKENNIFIGSGKKVTADLSDGAEVGLTLETASTQLPVYDTVLTTDTGSDQEKYLFADDPDNAVLAFDTAKNGFVLSERAMYVGFGRTCISPIDDRDGDGTATPFYVPLSGYGATYNRLSTYGAAMDMDGKAYELMADCTAILDAEKELTLLYALDVININEELGVYSEIRKDLVTAYAEFGLKEENISFTASHTHSGVDMSSTNSKEFKDTDGLTSTCSLNVQTRYKTIFLREVKAAAEAAVNDLTKVDKIETGTVGTTENGKRMNFVRHYNLGGTRSGKNYPNVNLGVYGSNFNSVGMSFKVGSYTYKSYVSSHTTTANDDMMLLRFTRQGAIPVMICNYRAHMTAQSGDLSDHPDKKEWYSPDWCAPFREKIEEELECHCSYFQGDCGNVNPKSYISNERIIGDGTKTSGPATCSANDFGAYGEKLAEFAIAGFNDDNVMERCDGDRQVVLKHVNYVGAYNSSYYGVTLDPDTAVVATDMNNYFNEKYNTSGYSWDNINEMLKASGGLIHSTYDAQKKLSRAKSVARTYTFTLKSIRIGDVGIITAPYEMFDTNGDMIREGGLLEGYKNVFVFGYSNGGISYVPSERGFTQGLYGTRDGIQFAGAKNGQYTTYVNGVETKKSYKMPNDGKMNIIGSYEADQCVLLPAVDGDGNPVYGTYEDGSPVYVGEHLAYTLVDMLKDVR